MSAVNFPQVQAPNYQGLGALMAQGGVDYSKFGSGIQQGMDMAAKQQEMALNAQTAPLKQRAMLMDYMNKQKEYVSDQSFAISQLPKEQQEGAYKLATGQMVQQGLMKPEEVPEWSKGGSTLVDQYSKQSKMYMENVKLQADTAKNEADIKLKEAQVGYYGAKASAAGKPGAQKPLSAESAKVAGLAQSGLNGLDQMEKLLQTAGKADLLSGKILPTIAQGQTAQDYDRLRNTISETLGRLNSGGAINKDEEARFMKMMPSWGDSPETKAAKIQTLRTQIGTVQQSMGLGGEAQTNAAPSRSDTIMQLKAQYPGLSDEQATHLAVKLGK